VGETSNYECACEIRDALWSLRDEMTAGLSELPTAAEAQPTFRQRAAIALLAALVGSSKESFPYALLQQDVRERFALIAWGIADALIATEHLATVGNLGERIAAREVNRDPRDQK